VEKKYLTWDDVHKLSDVLATKIKYNVKEPINSIVGLARGGLIPATIIANYLDVRKVYSIGAASYNGDQKTDDMEIYQELPQGTKDKINIFVDDISDTGDTFKTLFPDRNSYTATLHIKPHTGYIPTFYQDEINNDTWIVYPWER
jgi:hypoxanthine phosphoribosyltransferase